MIYFLTPDEARPSGGVRQAYLMVDLLCEMGHEAAIFHGTPGFRPDWFAHETPIVARPTLRLERGDMLVVPEYDGARKRDRCGDASVVMLNQNHFRTFINSGFEDRWTGAYPGWPNAVAAIATSEAIAKFLRAAARGPLPIHVVRVGVDAPRGPLGAKRRMICVMPRKRHHDAEAVVQLLHRSGLDGWEIVPIVGMPHDEVQRTLTDAAIFLSFSAGEGFGLPPAEAMAAGCYVVGFTGDGGREFMNHEWCSPIDDENLVSFAEEVVRIARRWESEPEAMAAIADRGRRFVTEKYSRDAIRGDVERAFTELAAEGSPALQTQSAEVTHWSVPIGPRGTLVRAKGRVVRGLRRSN
jgi:hypothetical protein